MFIASIRAPNLDKDLSQEIVQNLSAIRSRLNGKRIDGLVQTYLLRSKRGDSLLISVWESRNQMMRFIRSEEGRAISAHFGKLFSSQEIEFEELRPTWTGFGRG